MQALSLAPVPGLQGHKSAMDWPEKVKERRGLIFTLTLLFVSVLEEVFEEEKVKASYFGDQTL